MKQYRATAYNRNGYTFQFLFKASNWCEIETIAYKAMNDIISNDEFHQKHGPWGIRKIDIGE